MSDKSIAFVASGQIPPSPPPVNASGVVGWLRENLFSSIGNSILTILAILLLVWLVPGMIQWAFIDGVWNADSLKECRASLAVPTLLQLAATNGVDVDTAALAGMSLLEQEAALRAALGDTAKEMALHHGACWAVIVERFDQFIYGFYPTEHRWRPNLAFIGLLIAVAFALFDKMPFRKAGLIYATVYPIIAYFLIWGQSGLESIGLEPVESDRLGGFLLAVIIGVAGIVLSLPIGIVLALGRRSGMIFIQTICVVFIEFIRGVPLITLLFVANSVLAYFFPPGSNLDLILRVVIMVTLFSSAYMAEVIRGGLAALPSGQYEAADSLGLNYWKSMRLIILPQALKISIPNIVSSFIGLFKDTTLVVIIGLLDPIGLIGTIRADSAWNGIVWEFYVFVGLFFFICCFAMSRYSMYLERKLKTDR